MPPSCFSVDLRGPPWTSSTTVSIAWFLSLPHPHMRTQARTIPSSCNNLALISASGPLFLPLLFCNPKRPLLLQIPSIFLESNSVLLYSRPILSFSCNIAIAVLFGDTYYMALLFKCSEHLLQSKSEATPCKGLPLLCYPRTVLGYLLRLYRYMDMLTELNLLKSFWRENPSSK